MPVKNLKIGQYLATIWTKVCLRLTFWATGHPVDFWLGAFIRTVLSRAWIICVSYSFLFDNSHALWVTELFILLTGVNYEYTKTSFYWLSRLLSFNAQYTPPTRLNCRVESRRRRVGVGGVYWIRSRRLPTKIWKLNMLRIYPVEWSRVELCRPCVRARRLSWPGSLYVTGAETWKLGHDWRLMRSHCRHDATRLRCRQIVQTRRDL